LISSWLSEQSCSFSRVVTSTRLGISFLYSQFFNCLLVFQLQRIYPSSPACNGFSLLQTYSTFSLFGKKICVFVKKFVSLFCIIVELTLLFYFPHFIFCTAS
jgi:hypothetical protein